MINRSKFLAFAAGALALAAASAQAAYPEKPISLIVAYDVGGSTDVTARLLAPFIEKHLGGGARVEVVNKPGAGGEIGFAAIADSAPDGYTIGFINSPNVVSIPIERQARFSLDRLDPLVNIVDDPGVWAVPADSPFKTVKDVVDQAKANPNTITVGSTGVGSDDQLAMLLVQRQASVQFIHVPFSGSSANYKAMLAKKIQICATNLGEGLRGEATDPVRVIGVMSKERWKVAPNLPTFADQGFPVLMASLRGIATPKGVSPDIRAKLVEAVTKAATDPDFVAKAEAKETFQPLRVFGSDAFTAELKQIDVELKALWQASPWLK
ncbi:tripartite tricarboxylate transporter substrate binding protein [Azospirillum isscasi]|uniref:Tripartite tricarboxylate transporter substrate binding protein n=1 Tax=Azospirillum isscasi TaxID=3053926 RepID=A0ABU0WG92_9PROT|nr:tripartite tricarboxylate transporter substrate binding protein [Azospirillum isscasi]MDQ2102922.1 tripartite tricarboxylate transporter substrate binding protein [Azospirillum isscasi]